jgi:transposase
MTPESLNPNRSESNFVCYRHKDGAIEIELRTHQHSAPCPSCGQLSSRVHSRYRRKIADLPWGGLPAHILLQTRRFFCVDERCSRRIFTERVPGIAGPYARRSSRLRQALTWVSLALGGRAGARLAARLCLPASRATMLRTLRAQSHCGTTPSPRVLGIDEWAWKKGHRYGTILCDLEAGRVVDLLPTRDAETVATWLRQHPTVQVVSRDRAGAFADAIVKGAPSASQVADRWHLLNNLLETLIALLERHRGVIREVRETFRGEDAQPAVFHESEATRTTALQRKTQSRQRRIDLYQRVRELIDNGQSQTQAAASLGLGLRTVQRWVACGVFRERKHREFSSQVDAFGPYLQKRVADGCSSAMVLWREISQQGYRGKMGSVWGWLHRCFGGLGNKRTATAGLPVKRRSPLCLEKVAWLMLKATPRRSPFLKALYRASTELKSLARAAKSFFEMIRKRDASAWPAWLQTALSSPLSSFARRLQRDASAVAEALRLPWSNGMVEGQIHRLKLIKRQMYGRAGFDLLRLRVLQQT